MKKSALFIATMAIIVLSSFTTKKINDQPPFEEKKGSYHAFLAPQYLNQLNGEQFKQALIELYSGNFRYWNKGRGFDGNDIKEIFRTNVQNILQRSMSDQDMILLVQQSEIKSAPPDMGSTYQVGRIPENGGVDLFYRLPYRKGDKMLNRQIAQHDETGLFFPGSNIMWAVSGCGNVTIPVPQERPPVSEEPPIYHKEPLVPKDTSCPKGGTQTVTVNGQPITITVNTPPAAAPVYAPAYPSEIIVRNKANGWDIANTIFNGISAVSNVKQAWFPENQNIRIVGQQGGWGQYPYRPDFPPFTPVYPGGGSGGNGGGPVSPPNGYPVSAGNGGYTPVYTNNGNVFTPVRNNQQSGGGFTPVNQGGGRSHQWN